MGNLVFRINVSFSPALRRKVMQESVPPQDWLVAELKKKYELSDVAVNRAFVRCSVMLPDADAASALEEEIAGLLMAQYGYPQGFNGISVQVLAMGPENRFTASGALDNIESLIGAPQFKALARECAAVAAGMKENDLQDVFLRRSYLIAINDGCGLTTYLKAFADLVRALGLFPADKMDDPVREVTMAIPSPDDDIRHAVRRALGDVDGLQNCVVCVDLSEWMDRLKDKVCREALRRLYSKTDKCIFFFRVPYVEQTVLQRICASLSDVLVDKAVSIAPFSPEELRRYAKKALEDRRFTLEEDAWELFDARIAAEKSDGRFYGIDTVENVVNDMLYRKQLYNARNAETDHLIRKEEIRDLVAEDRFSERPGMEQLEELVGVEAIRDKILELLAQFEAAAAGGPDRPAMHMRFVGAPGTGKTTVARIMGKILAERGVLRSGAFFEYFGRDLCGRYVGQTTPKTAAACRDAYGSVLFIDEAYSLFRSDRDDSLDYGREVIDTLIAQMENHRTDLLVIFAGYPDEMELLMKSNPGLAGRMPYQIEFPNYTRQQLAEIFFRFAEKHFTLDEDLRAAVEEYFLSLSDSVVGARDFGNARFVRNVYERTWGKAALRCQLQDLPCDTLTAEDFRLAVAEKDLLDLTETKRIGF